MGNSDAKLLEGLLNAPASGRILSKDMDKYVKDCCNGEKPPCRCVCPLDLDVVMLNTKLQKGNFNSAYTMYRDKVLFPGIVSKICDQPCLNVCVRKDIDDAIDMLKLEKAIVDYTRSTAPVKYRVLKKNKKVAILGAGLCGLSCTVKLASHGYDVTIFEKKDKIGGRLWDLLSPDIFIPEIENQMQFFEYTLKLDTEIENIGELQNHFDAVLIATGKDGASFGLLEGLNRDSLGSAIKGIFLAGFLLGTTPMQSIEQGIRAAQSIESYLQTNRMHVMLGIDLDKTSRLRMDIGKIEPSKGVKAERYSKEEAVYEAKRCLKCDCRDCINACDMIKRYNKMPKRIAGDVRMTLNPVESLQPRVATRMLSSCNNCGLCGTVCPENIDMGDFLLEARRIMHREGSLPPAFHDFWIRDMKFAASEKAYVAKNAPGYQKSEYIFFPGCQLGASEPAYVERPYAYLLKKFPQSGIILSCCGAPAEWAGDEPLTKEITAGIRKQWEDMGKPVAILACPTCEKMFTKYLPQIKKISLYDFIKEHGLPLNHIVSNAAVSIFDPCSSRYDESMQKSVRELVLKAGFAIDELPYREKTAQCCGYGGHIYTANPALAKDIARKRIELGQNPYITYCTNCRDIFADMGKPCRHVLDVLFDINGELRKPPSLTDRRNNRVALKASLLKNIWQEESYEERQKPAILISPELMEKLNKQLIVEDDIRETIEYCESSGNKIFNPAKGYYIGHQRQGVMTYWVIYQVEEGAYRIINAYCHRLTIEGE
ncbi:NAD-dependent dihydropyrimidine dehydrogenase subunit PreT [Pelotomaculum schinkii]|uniref:NAD-dependent dihydropyrimidine dehydrogenase subunit PreT n=1 Tax=Pelotomaculum schinkii TaxID=78350 RepID=A0A4Y7RHT8_9FIRM|nr:pyridine nucleotide-disulfide oxidoreductase/dicluster-binding protein [Pelotomaculum schinkii]TEB08565.1 NAD-dependent dihydropyrimidine dehydrogenase subunit PreT [Pelotomaculum schinkii]